MDQLLGQLASSVSGAQDLEALTRPLLELLETVTGLESTYLTTVDEVEGVQHILYARNSRRLQIPEGLSVPWDDTLCKRALMEQRPYTSDVGACWGDSAAAKALGIQTYLSQPVRKLDGQLYGTLCAASDQQVAVPPNTIAVLNLFARLIAFQVERERMLQSLRRANEELASHASTDPLTGMANRRALIAELQRMLDRCRRESGTVQIAFLDLDGFKAINDHHGHEIGDAFLVHIARRLMGGVRASDFVARYGGDEFVVVTLNAHPEELQARLQALTTTQFVIDDRVIESRGASIGIISSTAADRDVIALLSRADAAMYASKRQRKDSRHAA